MTFNPLKPKTKTTVKVTIDAKYYDPKYTVPLEKNYRQAKRAKRAYKCVSVLLLAALITLGFFYRNLQVTTELNLLKQRMETEHIQKAIQSNAAASSTPETIPTSTPQSEAPQRVMKASVTLGK